jgi:hypothetical protein
MLEVLAKTGIGRITCCRIVFAKNAKRISATPPLGSVISAPKASLLHGSIPPFSRVDDFLGRCIKPCSFGPRLFENELTLKWLAPLDENDRTLHLLTSAQSKNTWATKSESTHVLATQPQNMPINPPTWTIMFQNGIAR